MGRDKLFFDPISTVPWIILMFVILKDICQVKKVVVCLHNNLNNILYSRTLKICNWKTHPCMWCYFITFPPLSNHSWNWDMTLNAMWASISDKITLFTLFFWFFLSDAALRCHLELNQCPVSNFCCLLLPPCKQRNGAHFVCGLHLPPSEPSIHLFSFKGALCNFL